MSETSRYPAGWYPTTDGQHQRYFDGTAWTEHVIANQPSASPTPPVGAEPVRPSYPEYPGAAGWDSPGWGQAPAGYQQTAWGAPTGLQYASWGARAGAYVLDQLPLIAISIFSGVASAQTVEDSSAAHLILLVTLLAAFAAVVANYVYLQGKTGQTIGKRSAGIAVYRTGTIEPPGYGLAFLRLIASVLNSAPWCIPFLYLGYLWPLWDEQKRTFADMACNTRVYKV